MKKSAAEIFDMLVNEERILEAKGQIEFRDVSFAYPGTSGLLSDIKNSVTSDLPSRLIYLAAFPVLPKLSTIFAHFNSLRLVGVWVFKDAEPPF